MYLKFNFRMPCSKFNFGIMFVCGYYFSFFCGNCAVLVDSSQSCVASSSRIHYIHSLFMISYDMRVVIKTDFLYVF